MTFNYKVIIESGEECSVTVRGDTLADVLSRAVGAEVVAADGGRPSAAYVPSLRFAAMKWAVNSPTEMLEGMVLECKSQIAEAMGERGLFVDGLRILLPHLEAALADVKADRNAKVLSLLEPKSDA